MQAVFGVTSIYESAADLGFSIFFPNEKNDTFIIFWEAILIGGTLFNLV